VVCPLIGWAAWYWYPRDLEWPSLILLAIVPAVCAVVGNAALGRRGVSAAIAGLLAAAIGVGSFFLFLLVWLLTLPPDFFQ
jgi:hypothetical protein